MAKGSKFTKEYKQEIVRLITELDKNPTVAKDIGVTPTTVRKWVRQFSIHGEDAFPGKGNLHPEDAERRRLENENKDFAILKKAMAIFSRDVN
jgi:transposase